MIVKGSGKRYCWRDGARRAAKGSRGEDQGLKAEWEGEMAPVLARLRDTLRWIEVSRLPAEQLERALTMMGA
jgi:hypothetical protein